MKPATVDAYVEALPTDVQPIAQHLRALIHAQAPGCTEAIGYGMPAFLLRGKAFLYLGVWKKHVALYPIYPTDSAELEALVGPYRTKTDTLHFPLNRPMPDEVISAVAAFKVGATEP